MSETNPLADFKIRPEEQPFWDRYFMFAVSDNKTTHTDAGSYATHAILERRKWQEAEMQNHVDPGVFLSYSEWIEVEVKQTKRARSRDFIRFRDIKKLKGWPYGLNVILRSNKNYYFYDQENIDRIQSHMKRREEA